MSTPNTDIVIGVRNCSGVLIECLNSLDEHTRNKRVIFVVDHGDPSDHMVVDEYCRRHTNSLKITTFYQRWFTRSFNLGLRMVRTPWTVILNADTIPRAGWLEELYSIKELLEGEGRKVGCVGSVLSHEEPRRYDLVVKPNFVTAHCVLINMQALFECSAAQGMPGIYLDEREARTIHIFSDNEMSYRMQDAGYVTARAFKSWVDHHGFKSWGGLLGTIPHTVDAVNERWE